MNEIRNPLGLSTASSIPSQPHPALWRLIKPPRLAPTGERSCEQVSYEEDWTRRLSPHWSEGKVNVKSDSLALTGGEVARRVGEGVWVRNDTTRRHFLYSLSALAASQIVKTKEAAPPGAFGIAYTSFPIRTRQSGQSLSEGADPIILAEKFIDLCKSFGADGCQMDIAQLSSADDGYLKRLRAMVEDKGMFLELSVNARVLENPDELAQVAETAHALGASRLRMAINGRRYEEFFEMKKWKDFAAHWQEALEKVEPMLKQHRLLVGIENHKEWLSDELAGILRRISSSHLGACVDFGNNLALLEDSLEVAQKLAPYAVTTHLKDMAVGEYEEGFLLAEVPLGQGILPLAKIMEALRRGRSDIHFCLEMITRDPLQVPYLDDKYWATYEKRDDSRIEKFKSQVLSKASSKPLPKISGTSSARMLAIEDDNIRRCVSYSKRTLGL